MTNREINMNKRAIVTALLVLVAVCVGASAQVLREQSLVLLWAKLGFAMRKTMFCSDD
jgi:hypothetical protein